MTLFGKGLKHSEKTANKIVSLLLKADKEGKYLSIVLTGEVNSGKTTIKRMVGEKYKNFYLPSDTKIYLGDHYDRTWDCHYTMLLSSKPTPAELKGNLAVIDYTDDSWDLIKFNSLLYMKRKFNIGRELTYRAKYKEPTTTKFHTLFIIEEEKFKPDKSKPVSKEYILVNTLSKKRKDKMRKKAAKKIQDWWMEILLNPHHPVGHNYLYRQAVKACDY